MVLPRGPIIGASTARRQPTVAGALGFALVLAAACSHPWDDYLADETGAGGGPNEALVQQACTGLCDGYDACGWAYPNCSTVCPGQMASCSTLQVALMVSCADESDCSAQGKTTFETCIEGAGCYTLP